MIAALGSAAFHHIGIASTDLDFDETLFSAFGYHLEQAECIDHVQGVRARFLVGAGPRIELVCDLAGRKMLSDLTKRGTKLYHIAYEVDDLETAIGRLETMRAKQVVAPVPGAAFGMRRICFYVLPNLMLIELISRS